MANEVILENQKVREEQEVRKYENRWENMRQIQKIRLRSSCYCNFTISMLGINIWNQCSDELSPEYPLSWALASFLASFSFLFCFHSPQLYCWFIRSFYFSGKIWEKKSEKQKRKWLRPLKLSAVNRKYTNKLLIPPLSKCTYTICPDISSSKLVTYESFINISIPAKVDQTHNMHTHTHTFTSGRDSPAELSQASPHPRSPSAPLFLWSFPPFLRLCHSSLQPARESNSLFLCNSRSLSLPLLIRINISSLKSHQAQR